MLFIVKENRFSEQNHTGTFFGTVPAPDTDRKRERIRLKGELTSPIDPKPGCRFAARCAYAKPECFERKTLIEEVIPGHFVRCHFAREINGI